MQTGKEALLLKYQLNNHTRTVSFPGNCVSLGEIPFRLAHYILQRPSRILSRQTLLKDVWGIEIEIETRRLDVHINTLRRSIELDGRHGWALKKLPQESGYILVKTKENIDKITCSPPYHINHHTRTVSFEGNYETMSVIPFRLASHILMRPNYILTRESLLKEVWGIDADVTGRRIDTHMSTLRHRISLNGRYGWTLKSLRANGYVLKNSTTV